MAFILLPIVQEEFDVFANLWNSHRIRRQKDVNLPTGVPNHIYSFPQKYGLHEFGFDVTDQEIDEAFAAADLEVKDDFIGPEHRQMCEKIFLDPSLIEAASFKEAYIFLKEHLCRP